MKSIFTIPKVVKYDDLTKPWFVYFRYNKKLFRFKFGINYIQNYRERLLEANALKAALHQKLKEGWNPNIPDIVATQSDLSFVDSLDFAILKKTPNIAPKTLSGYNGTIKFVKAAVEKLDMNLLPIVDTKRVHVKLIMEKAKEQRKWTNNAYNKHLNHLKAILSELLQWDIIENNPAHKILNLPVEESDANNPASLEDIEIIKTELSTKYPDYFNFILTEYHTGIRPKEILSIQLEHINLDKAEIVLPARNTKKKKRKRIVPINQHLMKYFESMELDQMPKHFYLFGSFREAGKGNIGKFKDFIPGPTAISRDTATRRWETIVKKGLGIDMNMYAFKHHGANMKILAGMSMEALKDLFGHTSKLTTKVYVTRIHEISRKEILEKSPAL